MSRHTTAPLRGENSLGFGDKNGPEKFAGKAVEVMMFVLGGWKVRSFGCFLGRCFFWGVVGESFLESNNRPKTRSYRPDLHKSGESVGTSSGSETDLEA